MFNNGLTLLGIPLRQPHRRCTSPLNSSCSFHSSSLKHPLTRQQWLLKPPWSARSRKVAPESMANALKQQEGAIVRLSPRARAPRRPEVHAQLGGARKSQTEPQPFLFTLFGALIRGTRPKSLTAETKSEPLPICSRRSGTPATSKYPLPTALRTKFQFRTSTRRRRRTNPLPPHHSHSTICNHRNKKARVPRSPRIASSSRLSPLSNIGSRP